MPDAMLGVQPVSRAIGGGIVYYPYIALHVLGEGAFYCQLGQVEVIAGDQYYRAPFSCFVSFIHFSTCFTALDNCFRFHAFLLLSRPFTYLMASMPRIHQSLAMSAPSIGRQSNGDALRHSAELVT